MRPIIHHPVIDADNLSLKFQTGYQRESLQSIIFNFLKGKQQKKNYLWALKDLSFKAYTGEIIGIIGENGQGKTTLCRVISGVLKPNAGTIKVNGEVSALLSLGTGFNIQLSGRENIYLNSLMLGRSKKQTQELVEEIWEFSGLGHFIDEPIKNYSSGMRARLAFSIGATILPDILILDETLSTGDKEFSQRAGDKLKSVIKRSRAVIVVTHNLDFVEQFCTRALWIDKGGIKEDGSPHEVPAHYKAYVKSKPVVAKPKPVQFTRPDFKKEDEVVVQTDDVGIRFRLEGHSNKHFWPLKNVNFSVKKGEIVGIIGRNGGGKTTLCRILSGILQPDQGKVFVDGNTTALLTFGAGFNLHLTGRDNIFLNGLMLGIPKARLTQVSDEIIEFSKLGSYIDQPVKNYSSGMRSRLGFSIASVLEPDIFIIDEALNAGDMTFHQKANVKIQEMIEESKAVLIVTHNLPYIKQVCSRALWIKDGGIFQDGSPEEVIALYEEHLTQLQKKRKVHIRELT